MLGSPIPTQYDLRFRALGIPVRVHWTFWLATLLLSGLSSLEGTLIWIGCVFVSILVHEMGHGLMARLLGYRRSEIILYSMGGLCYSEGERQSPGERVAVLFAGPGAGFLLLGLTMLAGSLAWGISARDDLNLCLTMLGLRELGPFGVRVPPNPLLFRIYGRLVEINLLWGILNLLPIWPLDGGQITKVFLTLADRRHGPRWTHIVGMITAAVLAAHEATSGSHESPFSFRLLFFAYFALVNFQQLQIIHETSRYGLDDDAEWWRK